MKFNPRIKLVHNLKFDTIEDSIGCRYWSYDTSIKSGAGVYEWINNYQWQDEMKYVDIELGSYGTHLIFGSVLTGKLYKFPPSNYKNIIADMCYGYIKGTFYFIARGNSRFTWYLGEEKC